MAIVLRRRARCSWIAGLAAIVVGSQPVPAEATILETRLASSHDDAEEFATGAMSLSSSDLELAEDGGPQTVGMRWVGSAIPHGATITTAWIQFTCKDAHDQAATLAIGAEDSDDAAPFSSTAFDLTSRARTALDVDWTPAPWLAGEAGAAERTPDLAAILQPVVDRPGWAPGQAIVIIIRGSGVRTAWSWDGNAAAAALLHVEFTGGDPPPPPSSWPIALYAGYYDTHHPGHTQPKPDPWKGSPGVVFVGTSDSDGGWDSSCLRLDNLSWDELTNVVVSVDIGADFHFALWGTRAIPPHGTLILAQTGFENFDGSDTNEAGCVSCSPTLCMTKVSGTIPTITVKIGGTTTRFFDHGQVLNTHGVDAAGCPYTGSRNDESRDWVLVPPEGMVAGVPPDATPELPDPTAVTLAAPVPNPARHSVVHRFSTPVQGRVHLGMYDVAGRLVRTCVDAELEAGVYLRGMDLAGVTPGVYFSVLRAAGSVARRPFVVAR